MLGICVAVWLALGVGGDDAAWLKSLAVDAGKTSPGFSGGRTAYTLRVGHGVEAVRITAQPVHNETALSVNGAAVNAGEMSQPVPLEVGRNLVNVEVAAAGGQSRTIYTVKVFRDYPTPSWTKVTDTTAFPPRDSAGELVFQNRMWLLGGFIPEVIGDVWSSTDGREWTAEGAIPGEAGVNIPLNVIHDNQMWVTCNDGSLYNSADGKTWSLVTATPPWGKRYAAGGAAFQGRMWLLGGIRYGTLFNDVWSSVNGVDWTCETEHAPWSRRQLFGLVSVFDEKLWILGGGVSVYHPFKAYNDVWSTQDGREWTKVLDAAPWPGRIWSASVVYRNRLWILGGFQSEPVWRNLNDVWYSADGVDWRELKSETVWSPRHELSPFVYDGKLWVVAGNEWPLKNDVWYLDIPGLTFVTQPVVEEFLGAEYTYRARADFNASRGKVHYRLTQAPEWLAVDPDGGVLRGTPEVLGDYPITVEARDDAGETATQTYTLHVVPAT